MLEQDEAVRAIVSEFPRCRVTDYRSKPQNGYRAVHVIVNSNVGRLVEIQIRTAVQNAWANGCESLAVAVDPAVKYGGGPPDVQRFLTDVLAVGIELDEFVAALDRRARQLRSASEALDDADPYARTVAERRVAEYLADADAISREVEDLKLAMEARLSDARTRFLTGGNS
jgi:ppGpp synthetase/RelA/SpoT-type nucleotidyltranferase